MKKKIKIIVAVLLAAFLMIGSSIAVAEEEANEANGVVVESPTNDAGTIYERYKDNSFQLLTKEATSLTGVKAAIQNSTGIVKELVWSGVMNLGKFNTALVKYMFSFDMEKPIKKPMLNITAQLATGMLTIASGIGILSVGIVMILKFMAEQNIKGVAKIFFMTIGIFASLVVLSNSTRTEHISSAIVNADNLVESTFITINPIFTDEETTMPEQNVPGDEVSGIGAAGETNYLEKASYLIASKIFKSSVYEPYLIFNYGTSNTETIRRKTVEYKGTEYDRIGILLDNDFSDAASDEIYTKVTEYESEKLKNNTISWKNNLALSMQGVFYLFLNLVQTVIYFLLCVLRLILVFLRWVLFPLLPIMFLMGMFNFQTNVFKNGAMGFVTIIGLKGLVSFAMVFVASYMSLGYSVAADVDDPFIKIITILVYLCMPIGVVFFKDIIGKMLTGNLSLSDLGSITRSPFLTARRMKKASKKQAKEGRKQRKHNRKMRKQDLKDREEERERKKHNDFKNPKSRKSERSNKRAEKTPENNIGGYRRYRDKAKEAEKKKPKERKESFSARRAQRPDGRAKIGQQRLDNMKNRMTKLHSNSRYQEVAARVNQKHGPDRQRLKEEGQQRQMKQSQQRQKNRQQEKMRVTSTGLSPRRSGQSTQARSGEVRQVANNSRRSAGKRYQQATEIQEVVVKSQRRQRGQSNVSGSMKKKTRKQTVQQVETVNTVNKVVKPGKRTSASVNISKSKTVGANKGVRRRRV